MHPGLGDGTDSRHFSIADEMITLPSVADWQVVQTLFKRATASDQQLMRHARECLCTTASTAYGTRRAP